MLQVLGIALAAIVVAATGAGARSYGPKETADLVRPEAVVRDPAAAGRMTLRALLHAWKADFDLRGLTPRTRYVVRLDPSAAELGNVGTSRRGRARLRLDSRRLPPAVPASIEDAALEVVDAVTTARVLAGVVPHISPVPDGGGTGGGTGGAGGTTGGGTTTRLAGVDGAGPFGVAQDVFSLPTARGGLAPGSGTTVYYPGTGTQIAATPATFPPIVVVHAFQLHATDYSVYGRMLASWGFVVLVGDHTDPFFAADNEKEVQTTIGYFDWLCAQNADSTSRFYGRLDVAKMGVMGHSLGGGAAVVAATRAASLGRVKACVALAPAALTSSSSAAIPADTTTGYWPATLVVTGSQDAIVQPATSKASYFTPSTTTRTFLRFKGACHMNFADSVTGLAVLGSDYNASTCVTAAEETRETRTYLVSWFLSRLKGDSRVSDYVDGKYAAVDPSVAEAIFVQ